MTKFVSVRKILVLILALASNLSHAYDACFLPNANVLVPFGTTYKVGPNLASAINTYSGVGAALLAGINVWNVEGYFTNGRLVSPSTISTDDCPTGLSLQVGFYEFYGSTCPSAVTNGLTGSIPNDLDNLPLGFVDFYNQYPCTTCNSRSISLNANVVFSLNPLPGEVDLQSVMAHETGHIFGIAHGERSTAFPLGSCERSDLKSQHCTENIERETMGNYIYRGETCVRTLNSHDILNATTAPP